jgi:hypothetical protein
MTAMERVTNTFAEPLLAHGPASYVGNTLLQQLVATASVQIDSV